MIHEVFNFNRQCLNVERKEVPHLEHKHAMFCVKAIREEALELEVEHLDSPMTEGGDRLPIEFDPTTEDGRWQTVRSVDAAIDAAYFAIGLMARAGLSVEQAVECMLAVHNANMTKKLGVNAKRDTGAVDAVKPADFVPPDEKIYEILFGTRETVTDVIPGGDVGDAAEPVEV